MEKSLVYVLWNNISILKYHLLADFSATSQKSPWRFQRTYTSSMCMKCEKNLGNCNCTLLMDAFSYGVTKILDNKVKSWSLATYFKSGKCQAEVH